MTRKGSFHLRLTPDDLVRLAELAEHFALSRTNALRMIIKEKHDRLAEQKSK